MEAYLPLMEACWAYKHHQPHFIARFPLTGYPWKIKAIWSSYSLGRKKKRTTAIKSILISTMLSSLTIHITPRPTPQFLFLLLTPPPTCSCLSAIVIPTTGYLLRIDSIRIETIDKEDISQRRVLVSLQCRFHFPSSTSPPTLLLLMTRIDSYTINKTINIMIYSIKIEVAPHSQKATTRYFEIARLNIGNCIIRHLGG